MTEPAAPRRRPRPRRFLSFTLCAAAALAAPAVATGQEGEAPPPPPEEENASPAAPGAGAGAAVNPPSKEAVLVTSEGTVEWIAKADDPWVKIKPGHKLKFGHTVRTGEYSRAAVRLPNGSVIRLRELSTVVLRPPSKTVKNPRLRLRKGSLYLFSKEKQEVAVETPSATGAIRGTEFELRLEADGSTVLGLVEGEVELAAADGAGALTLSGGEEGRVTPGRAPAKTALLDARNIVQWYLYYPAVLALEDIPFSPAEEAAYAASLAAYRAGDLPGALDVFPAPAQAPAGPAGRYYLAGLVLSRGQVDTARTLIAGGEFPALGRALKELIAAVRGGPGELRWEPAKASGYLARSYLLQSRTDLEGALAAAARAVDLAPGNAYALARRAALEYAFGRHKAALATLDEALAAGPRNAAAHALDGFVHAARGELQAAREAFGTAIALDGALADGWAGRGLVHIRMGDGPGGREDLLTAAALEPGRSVLRSYLAKALSAAGEAERAATELALAVKFDPQDPTPWLYSALINKRHNRFNAAVRDLERSLAQNDNRRLYRSRFLLDQDRAVRGANLAAIYDKVEMEEIAVREANDAVAHDYTNYAAHLFLASSYDQLRDPRRFELRFETAALNELLLANLLAPASAGAISAHLGLHEQVPLFAGERQRGLDTRATYYGQGEFRQVGSAFAHGERTSVSVDFDYHLIEVEHDRFAPDPDGSGPNNHSDRAGFSAQIKHQLTPDDSVFLQVQYQRFLTGEVSRRQFGGASRPDFDADEEQFPNVVAGLHHHWGPGSDTLFLAGHLEADVDTEDDGVPLTILGRDAAGAVTGLARRELNVGLARRFEVNSAELQHIFQNPAAGHTLLFGGRFQEGDLRTRNLIGPAPARNILTEEEFERVSLYGYAFWEPAERLTLIGGVTYDELKRPDNFRSPPISPGGGRRDQLSPKAGFIWEASPGLTVRGAYTQSLSGLSFDESFRLEPTQVAGFLQGFRTLISESVVGSLSGARFETAGFGATQKLPGSNTYVDLRAIYRGARADNTMGVFSIDTPPTAINTEATEEKLDYEERSLAVTVNKLIGEEWALAARYELTHAELGDRFTEIPTAVAPRADTDERSTLHRTALTATYNHPSGWFARAEGRWLRQHNRISPAGAAGADEDVVFFDLLGGYRSENQRWEAALGLLNIGDQDYELAPLTTFLHEPRERTVFATVRVSF